MLIVNTVLPLCNTHSWYTQITPSNPPPLSQGTPWTLQSIQCSTNALTAQNIATQTAALCGQNSDQIKLKQTVNINVAVFSGNQAYVLDKTARYMFLTLDLSTPSLSYIYSRPITRTTFSDSNHDSIPSDNVSPDRKHHCTQHVIVCLYVINVLSGKFNYLLWAYIIFVRNVSCSY